LVLSKAFEDAQGQERGRINRLWLDMVAQELADMRAASGQLLDSLYSRPTIPCYGDDNCPHCQRMGRSPGQGRKPAHGVPKVFPRQVGIDLGGHGH
jgi:hypothetical protein